MDVDIHHPTPTLHDLLLSKNTIRISKNTITSSTAANNTTVKDKHEPTNSAIYSWLYHIQHIYKYITAFHSH